MPEPFGNTDCLPAIRDMEVVGALAGVTKLAAYAYSAGRVLLRLIRQIEEGRTVLPDSYNNSLFLLLDVVQRLRKEVRVSIGTE